MTRAIPKSNRGKLLAAVLLLGTGVGFAWLQVSRQRPSAPDDAFIAQGPVRVTREERDQMREQMLADLDLTPEQRAQIEKDAPPMQEFSFQGMQQRREAMEKILTPQQMEKLHASMQSRMRERLQKDLERLPEGEREKFMEKLEERMQNGPPGGPPPGGPPP